METMRTHPAVAVDYYPSDGSVFLDTHYLIKGVAGALFWKLACEHQHRQRSEFSLRELRLARHELRLPDVQDNLSVRMLLLQRRLASHGAAVQIVKVGRGRFRVDVQRPLRLNEKCAAPSLPAPHPVDWLPADKAPGAAAGRVSRAVGVGVATVPARDRTGAETHA